MSAGQMMMDRSDSKIAEMTIKGNQTGMNKTIKHLHDYSGRDADVKALAEKLLSTEESNAKQLEKYL